MPGRSPLRSSRKNVRDHGGATAKDIAPMADRYPHLKSVTLYADTTSQALQVMKLSGHPAVLGVKAYVRDDPD